MWTYSKRFDDDKNKIILDSNYIFSFSKYDGFCERLLGAEILVDYNFNYTFQMKAFKHEKNTKNKSDLYIENGNLKGEVLERIESFLNLNYKNLKLEYNYNTFDITDIGDQQFLINLVGETTNILIIDGLSREYFNTEQELLLFEINEYLKNWIENKYEDWIN